MTIKAFGRNLADHLANAAGQPIDLRRECHCGRNGIGPHWHSLAEGCEREPVVPPAVEQPEDPAVTVEPPLCWCTGAAIPHDHDPSHTVKEFPCPPLPVARGRAIDPVETVPAALINEVGDAARAEHAVRQFGEREGALYVALRLTSGDDRQWSAAEVLAFTDYLLAGRELAETAECGHEIESLKVGKNGPATLRCALPAGHSTPTPHRDGNGTSWTRTEEGQTT